MEMLRQKGVVATPAEPVQGRSHKLIEEFGLYLRNERALAPATIAYYLYFGRQFLLDRFTAGRVQLSTLRAADVVGFVQRQAVRLHRQRAKLLTTALRSFLQFARYSGYIQTDLAAAVPTVPNWSMASIPKALPAEHVRPILAHCNRQTAAGRRDYAILLLLVRLGLRAGEIVAMELDGSTLQRVVRDHARREWRGAKDSPFRRSRRVRPSSSFRAVRPSCAADLGVVVPRGAWSTPLGGAAIRIQLLTTGGEGNEVAASQGAGTGIAAESDSGS